MNLTTARQMVKLADRREAVACVFAAINVDTQDRPSNISISRPNTKTINLTIDEDTLKAILRSEEQALSDRIKMLEENT